MVRPRMSKRTEFMAGTPFVRYYKGLILPVELKKGRGRHSGFEAVIPYSRPLQGGIQKPRRGVATDGANSIFQEKFIWGQRFSS